MVLRKWIHDDKKENAGDKGTSGDVSIDGRGCMQRERRNIGRKFMTTGKGNAG